MRQIDELGGLMADILIIKCWNPSRNEESKVAPLGAMYLAAALREAGHEPKILHIGSDHASIDLMKNTIAERKPDVIGISAVVNEYRTFKELAAFLHDITPDVPVMVGGPLAWSDPITTLRVDGVKVIALGEAERTIVELVDALLTGTDPLKVAGTAVLRDGELVKAPPRDLMTSAELDALPFPAWDLIDLADHWKYRSMASVGIRRYMQVMTSRGCPYACIYCHGMMGRQYRYRSPESVIEEIRVLRERYDIHEFELVDDCFNLNRPRMHAILQGLIDFNDPKLRLQFPNGLRSDLLEEQDIAMLRRAGTSFISFAIETASTRLQKMIHKNLDIEKALRAITIANRAGIFCNGFFMLGFPTETKEEMESTIRLACSTDLHEALFFRVSPFKGTALYDLAMNCSDTKLSGINLDDLQYFDVEHNLSEIEDKEFGKEFTSAYRRFYLNPKRMLRILQRHPRRSQLLMYVPQILNKLAYGLVMRAKRRRLRSCIHTKSDIT